MKKRIAAVGVLALLLSLSVAVLAAELTQEGDTDTTMDITASILPTYTVSVPSGTKNVEFNRLSTDLGKIELDAAQLEPGCYVNVALQTDGTLKHTEDETQTIPYAIYDAATQAPFISARYTTPGENTILTVHITQEAWNRAYAGEYADTVTFTVSYIKPAP